MKTTKRKAYFEIYDAWGQHDETHEWRWRLVAKNSEVLASGEGFTTKASATRAVAAVKRAVIAITSAETEAIVDKLATFAVKETANNVRMVNGRDRR